MENTIYITGHRNPDTDSICSALAYANLKRKLGIDAQAIRLGNLNSETKFVLDYFKVDPPMLKYDIKPTINDIDIDDPIIALVDEPIKEVWHKMIVNNKNVAVVVTEEGFMQGLASITNITNALLSLSSGNYEYLQMTPLNNIAAVLQGRICHAVDNYSTVGQVLIASSTLGGLTEEEFGKRIAITSTRKETQIKAIKARAALVIACKAKTFDDDIIQLAQENDCCLICTPLDLIGVAQTITQAIPIGHIMTSDLISFNLYDYLDDVKEEIIKSRFRQYPVIDNQHRIVGLISRYHLLNATKKKIILIDHNEKSQSIEGVEEAEVIEIIDHHRLGDIQTDLPVFFRNEICGSSCTIVSGLYEENGIEIDKANAGIMLSAIISDTMNFKSPTCTKKDHLQAEKLSKICGVEVEALAQLILNISASLKGKSASEIVNNDIKTFNISSYRVGIGQVNIQSRDDITDVKRVVSTYMDSYCLANRLDLVAMLFSLVDGSGSYLMIVGKQAHLFTDAFAKNIVLEDELLFLPKIISRKQQVIPMLSKYLQVLKNL